MNRTDRKLIELVQKIRGNGTEQNLLIAKVNTLTPFTLKMYDLVINKHIYINSSFLKSSSNEVDNNIVWDRNQEYIPNTMLSFSKRMIKADLLKVGDMVVVLQDGLSFYVLERVVKVT